jgi:DNA polymerase-3 subunit delta
VLSTAALRAQIASRGLAPIYVLTGPDDQEKSAIASLFGDLIEPELRAFNVERFYGSEAKPRDIVEAARTLPMMADRRIVVVLQADRMLNPRRRGADESEEEPGDVEALVEYVNNPNPHATLVLVLGPADPVQPGRKGHDLLPLNGTARITKALARSAQVVECGQFSSEREVQAWLTARAKEAGLTVDTAAAQQLVDLAQGDPSRFRAAVDRVLMFAAGDGRVTEDHVERAVVAHEISTDDWALVRALERGQAADALRELRLRLESGQTPFAILGQIAWMVRDPRGRIPVQRVPAAIDALFRTDIAMKSSGGDTRVLLERLVAELCA